MRTNFPYLYARRAVGARRYGSRFRGYSEYRRRRFIILDNIIILYDATIIFTGSGAFNPIGICFFFIFLTYFY